MNRINYWKISRGKSFLAFIIICILYLLLVYINNKILLNDDFYTNLEENYSNQSILIIKKVQTSFGLITYFSIPFFLIVKVLLVSVVLGIGTNLGKSEIKLDTIFKSVLVSEFVFVLYSFIQKLRFYDEVRDISLQELVTYSPLSILSLIGYENVQAQWAIYPLQKINLFEVFYIALIAFLISKQAGSKFSVVFSLLFPPYSIALFLWITLVAFLTFLLT